MSLVPALIMALALAGVASLAWRYFRDARFAARENAPTAPAPFRFPKIHRLGKKDALAMLVITAIYAFVAFFNLGNTDGVQTFYRFESGRESLTIDLGEELDVRAIRYYTGSFHDRASSGRHDGYDLEISSDGENWRDYGTLTQSHAYTFHWMEREFDEECVEQFGEPTARYLRISAGVLPMELGEICIMKPDGSYLDPASLRLSTDGENFTSVSEWPAYDGDPLVDKEFENPSLLFDEQEFAGEQTYMNSMYFDEIYHARTAREFILEDDVYENTHPPLGKIFIALAIKIFGMTPFGWRFAGVFFGVLMVPLAYAFLQNLFGKTRLSAAMTTVFAFEFMHFTQTRIATIDTYGLFFTIAMYWLFYRFLAAGYDAPARSRLVPLALCGISFGLGIASKWTCFYAAAGLVILYIIGAVGEWKRLRALGRAGEFWKKFAVVVGVSFVFFVGVAGAIYYLSYIPFAAGNGYEFNLKTVWDNQTSMWSYHSGLSATHGHQSSWWMWLVDVRPILYVFKTLENGSTSAFSAFNTPIVSWAGLVALTALAASLYRGAERSVKLVGAAFAALIAASFAAQIATYAISYASASAAGLDLVDDVAYTNHPFSFVFAAAAVAAVVTPFAAKRGGWRLAITPIGFALALAALFASRLVGYDANADSLVAATDNPLGYAVAGGVCVLVGVGFALIAKFKLFKKDEALENFEKSSENSEVSEKTRGQNPVGVLGEKEKYLFLLIAYLAQLLAWIPVTRNTFAYHYFPSSFFIILALAALFDRWDSFPTRPAAKRLAGGSKLAERLRALPTGQRAAIAFCAACLALFALFYPYLSGAPVSRDYYFAFLRWLPSWPM